MTEETKEVPVNMLTLVFFLTNVSIFFIYSSHMKLISHIQKINIF